MKVAPRIGLAVGPADKTHWGQVLVMPNAYGIIEVEDEAGHAQQVGVAALSLLGQQLSREIASLRVVEEVANRVIFANIRTIILLVPVGHVVYLVVRGMGSVYLKRGEELASLMHEDGGISGEVQDGDMFLLASHGFSDVLSHDELTHLFDHLPPKDIAEKLTLLLHEKKGGEGSAALVFEIAKFEEDQFVEAPPEEIEPPQRGFTETLGAVIQRIRHVLSPSYLRQFVAHARRQPRTLTAIVAAALAFFFVVSVVLGVWKQTTAKKNQQTAAVLVDAQHAFDEGVALLQLNPVKGRERLSQAKQLLEPFIHTVSQRTTDGRHILTLYRQVTDNLAQAMQVVDSPLNLFYDVTLLKKGAAASFFARDGASMVITDQTTGAVYSVDIASKNAQIIGGGAPLSGLSFVGLQGDNVYVFTPESIRELRLSDKKVAPIIKKDDQWGTIAALTSFGGNVYLLDTQKSRIWKYVASEKATPAGGQAFSETREYLNPDTLPDLSHTTGMVIDGSVWMGTTDGGILRFTAGKENTFVPKGVDPAFGTKLVVYTSDDTKNVYVLDTQNSRVVVLDKDGIYLAQYRFAATQTPTDLLVFEEEKKMLLLVGGKIYGIDLK